MRLDRLGDAEYELELAPWQREMLINLTGQLRDLILEGSSPSIQRLYPTAYPNDVAANEDYQSMVHDQLLESRLAALETVEAHAAEGEPVRLDDDGLNQWMQSINSLRLTLGTRLDVSEDDDQTDLDEDDPDYPLRMVYHLLSSMLGRILDAAMGADAEAMYDIATTDGPPDDETES